MNRQGQAISEMSVTEQRRPAHPPRDSTEEPPPATDAAIARSPLGDLHPTDQRVAQALTAIGRRRLAEAQRHLSTLPADTPADRSWKLLVMALIAIEKEQLAEAESLLWQAAAQAFIACFSTGKDNEPDTTTAESPASNAMTCSVENESLRLAALALNKAGWVQRRRDRCEEASHTHLAAFRLREKHSALEELWETAIELGLDADVAGRHDEARQWYHRAIGFTDVGRGQPHQPDPQAAAPPLICGVDTAKSPLARQAIAWTHLSDSFAACGRHQDAVYAARTAARLWREDDASDAAAAQSDARLGAALVRLGGFRYEQNIQSSQESSAKSDAGDSQTLAVLQEALQVLQRAHDELAAFGPSQAQAAESCLRQIEFAQHLLQSIGTESD